MTREQIEKDMANIQVNIDILEEFDEDDMTDDQFEELEDLRIQYANLEGDLEGVVE